ncbi:thermonuclease family protein [Sinorhizobium medicae]|uniref:thermonuclease family protein n=1 Tax=Sinorhizobium medicae TaxID=110321 RepID=UPI000FDC9BA4|nr:thermonuclease family protein [Sinorhizobium medicae]RVK15123.1 thermonuclease family protein [Sinorhizobium medicae]
MTKTNPKRRKRSTRRKSSQNGMGRCYLAAAIIVGGIVAYDHRGELDRLASTSQLTALLSPDEELTEKKVQAKKNAEKRPPKKVELATIPIPVRPKEHTGSIAQKAALIPPAPVKPPVAHSLEQAGQRPPESDTFFFCGIRHDNCVLDGDTFLFNGQRILIADIDAPETKLAKCDEERSRGSYAKARLRELLNAGNFALVASESAPGDEPGKRRLVVRNGRSLGDILISEGLAKKRSGRPQSWCGQSTARVSG